MPQHAMAARRDVRCLRCRRDGAAGRARLCRSAPVPTNRTIALNINFDMVARGDKNELYIAGTHHTPALKPILEPVASRSQIKVLFGHDSGGGQNDWTTQSDHGAFHAAGIPFVYFGVEDHPDYHKPTDTADKINPAFFLSVGADDSRCRDGRSIAHCRCRPSERLRRAVARAGRQCARSGRAIRIATGRGSGQLEASAGRAVRAVQRPRRSPIRSSSFGGSIAPEDREIAGFCAAALAFGRVQSVLNSIEGLLAAMGPSPAAYVRASSLRAIGARSIISCIDGRAASIWPRSSGSCGRCSIRTGRSRGSSSMVAIRTPRRLRRRSMRFLVVRARLDRKAVYGRTVRKPGVVIFLRPAVERRRVQAAQPVSALDGPS